MMVGHVCLYPMTTILPLPLFCVRYLFHHHRIVPVESDCHHAGELSAPVHPQVPAQTLLSTQLLQADLLNQGLLRQVSGFVICGKTQRFSSL